MYSMFRFASARLSTRFLFVCVFVAVCAPLLKQWRAINLLRSSVRLRGALLLDGVVVHLTLAFAGVGWLHDSLSTL